MNHYTPAFIKYCLLTVCFHVLYFSPSILKAQTDSSLVTLAQKKLNTYHRFIELLANAQVSLSKKREIIQIIESHYLANKEVKLLNDLVPIQNPPARISATEYLKNIMVHHPEGAQITLSQPAISKVFYNGPKNETYVKFRFDRSFKAFNVISNKKIDVKNNVDVWVRLTERDNVDVKIIGSVLPSQDLNEPDELSRIVSEPKIIGNENAEKFENDLRLLDEHQKLILYAAAQAGDTKGAVSNNEQTVEKNSADDKNKKLLAKLERQKIKSEIRQARLERRRIEPPRLNIKAGMGMYHLDNALSNLLNNPYFWQNIKHNIHFKGDVLYRLTGLYRDKDNKWERGQSVGIFLSGGRMSGRTANDFMGIKNTAQTVVDTTFNKNLFFEAESGIMLKEQLRISAGYGVCRYGVKNVESSSTTFNNKGYALLTAGLSARLFGIAEADFNVSALLANGRVNPRVGLSVCAFLQTGRF